MSKGMDLRDAKATLMEPDALAVLALSAYEPTEEKMKKRAAAHQEDSGVSAYGCWKDGRLTGLVVLRSQTDGLEILSIGVLPETRGHGVASALLDHTREVMHPRKLVAETDDDAVGFYRRYGFDIQSLGEKYPGVVRYRCTLSCTGY